jgi:hypothetical protein
MLGHNLALKPVTLCFLTAHQRWLIKNHRQFYLTGFFEIIDKNETAILLFNNVLNPTFKAVAWYQNASAALHTLDPEVHSNPEYSPAV